MPKQVKDALSAVTVRQIRSLAGTPMGTDSTWS